VPAWLYNVCGIRKKVKYLTRRATKELTVIWNFDSDKLNLFIAMNPQRQHQHFAILLSGKNGGSDRRGEDLLRVGAEKI